MLLGQKEIVLPGSRKRGTLDGTKTVFKPDEHHRVHPPDALPKSSHVDLSSLGAEYAASWYVEYSRDTSISREIERKRSSVCAYSSIKKACTEKQSEFVVHHTINNLNTVNHRSDDLIVDSTCWDYAK